ncbi:MAG: DEAD/DEAH box helicase [Methanoregula sp.]|jgi:DNA repair protein RadD|nr:DEAD/DEAH box helicase [Methanoregula sp.]
MILRPYQQECIDKLYTYWKYIGKRPVVVAPMGSGKSAIIAGFCDQTLKQWPDTRILIVTDSKEIVSQNESELKRYWPQAPTGIYSAGLNRRDTTEQIIFAGVQSIYDKMFDFYPAFSVICIDEAHAVSRESSTMYGELIKSAMLANPGCGIWGTTGTPYRLDQGIIWEGKDAIFDGCANEIKIKHLIDNGFLCPIISKGGVKNIDLTNVHTVAGEYNQSELAHAADDPIVIKEAVDEIITYGSNRKSWMIFCAGVQHAHNVLAEIQSRGICADIVTGDMQTKDRDEVIRKFKAGEIRAIVNVNVLTKGVNVPECDLVVLLTATKSTAKYAQMAGRGLRVFPGKENCLLLDMGNNVVTHGELDNLRPIKTGNGGAPPLKQCPSCQSLIYASLRECPQCGYKYPEQEPLPTHGTVAFSGAVLTDQIEPYWAHVKFVEYFRHKKEGKPDSLKISYITHGGEKYNHWLAIDHRGFAAAQALRWLEQIRSDATSVDEALDECMKWPIPRKIKCKQDGKFVRIIEWDYTKEAKQESLYYD